ncbi:Protein SLOW WALKER 1, partial [Bienertia sinuspersici]
SHGSRARNFPYKPASETHFQKNQQIPEIQILEILQNQRNFRLNFFMLLSPSSVLIIPLLLIFHKLKKFKDLSFSASFCSDTKLIAAGSQSGPVRLAQYPTNDRLHLLFGGDDSIVKGGIGSNNHGKPVEDVTFLPFGGMIATTRGNVVKI